MEKVIDTLNDLPNVLWIVSEEASSNSLWWNTHQIAHIRAYESGKPHQHPIGYAAPIRVPDATIYDSDADWVAPSIRVSPASSCGAGKPACKVNINDSDHSYLGDVERDTSTESQLGMGKLHHRQSSIVHGPLFDLLPARGQEPVCLAGKGSLRQTGSAIRQPPG